MRIVLRLSKGGALERLALGALPSGFQRVELVLHGQALFGPRPRGGVKAREPERHDPRTMLRLAFDCGADAFDMFMHQAVEQTGKPFNFAWLAACRLGGLPLRDWRDPRSWSGPELFQWLSELAAVPLLDCVSGSFVTVDDIMGSHRLYGAGPAAATDEWQRWKVWGEVTR